MESQYLIDTNGAIDYLGNKLPLSSITFMNDIIDAIPNVSIITKIELLSFNAPDEHYEMLAAFLNDCSILDLTNNIVEVCIDIRKQHKTKLPDAIIAATALVYDMILISRNTSDFKKIKGLKVIDPYNL